MRNRLILTIVFYFFVFQFYAQEYKIDSLKNMLPKVKGKEKIKVYDQLGDIFKKSSPEICINYSRQAIKIAEELQDTLSIANSLYDIAIAYYYLNSYDSSEIYYNKSLDEFIHSGNELETDNIYNNLGNLYRKTGEFVKALENHYKALSIREKKADKKSIGYSYNNIGLTYKELKNYDNAILFLKKSMTIWKELENKYAYLFCINNLGIIYYKTSELDKSLEYHIEALEIEKELNSQKNMALTLNNIGMIHFELGSYEKSLDYFLRSLTIKRKYKNKYSIANTLNNIGKNYLCLKNFTLAKQFLDESLELSQEVNALQYMESNYLCFSILSASQQKMRESFVFLEKYKELKDSIFNENTSAKIAEIETKYEIDKKQKEIEILKKEQEIERIRAYRQRMAIYSFVFIILLSISFLIILMKQLKSRKRAYNLLELQKNQIQEKNSELEFRQNQILSQNVEIGEQRSKYVKLNATKDKFFSLIAHDLKSPFNSIIGFSELLAFETDQYDSGEIRKMATYINQSSKETYNLLTNLLEWSRTQTDNIAFNPKVFDLKIIVDDVFLLLNHSAFEKNINLISNIYKSILVYADKNMIETVVRNILSNAIKFTNNMGQIEVSIKETNDFVEMRIVDDGIGISDADFDKLFRIDESFSIRGTSNEKGTGLGLIICKEFVEKNGGRIWANSDYGKGSTFYFTIEKAK